jgi:hypothetical protein
MDLVFELIAQVIGQIIFELLANLGGRLVAEALESRVSASIAAAIGFGGGYAWGRHVADIGRTGVPRTIWVSLALAVVAAALALRTRDDPDWDERVASLPTIFRPTSERFATFSFLNLVIAIAVAIGFNA